MAVYTVTWDIEIDADSPEEAARLALEIQRDPASEATMFAVAQFPDTDAVLIDVAGY